MLDDLSFLVDETFEMAGHLKASPIPETAGLVYHLDAYPSIFVIRALAVENIRKTILDLKEFPENYPSLKLNQTSVEKVLFFKTQSKAMAQYLAKILSFKRYPVEEEILCSFTDPSFSLWFEESSKGFSLSAKMPTTEMTKLRRLGDLGEINEIRQIFQRINTKVPLDSKIKIFMHEHRLFFEGQGSVLTFFKKILLGEMPSFQEFPLTLPPEDLEDLSLLISNINFWQQIYSQLSDVPGSKGRRDAFAM